MNFLSEAPLGKKTLYISHYQRDLLFPITRKTNRAELGLTDLLPFKGVDRWNAYELSWLNSKGKPIIALGEFIFPCESPNMVEAKSFKLYLNSFNNTPFISTDKVITTLQRDLTEIAGAPVEARIILVDQLTPQTTQNFPGTCLDQLDVECNVYQVHPDFLQTEATIVTELLYSDLLKSNCLITGQPDWGSIQINYTGKKISHESLLKYIISFRNHNEFTEQCAERLFMDIMQRCAPQKLSIDIRYTRRGGIATDIYRSNESKNRPENFRLYRQ
jgi:7-cyano-7-deazaguanine reductase